MSKKRNQSTRKGYEYRIGQNIKRIREAEEISIEELTDEYGAGISRQYYWRIENGLSSPTIAVLRRLARYIGCHVSDFFIDQDGLEIPIDEKSCD